MRFILLTTLGLLTQLALAQAPLDVKKEFDFAAKQYEGMLAAHPDTTQFPQSTNPDGSPRNMKSSWWCSGFFGGSLWYLYEKTNDPKWKEAAHKWTMAVAKEQTNTRTHDLGFMLYCPFGNGYRLTKNPVYRRGDADRGQLIGHPLPARLRGHQILGNVQGPGGQHYTITPLLWIT